MRRLELNTAIFTAGIRINITAIIGRQCKLTNDIKVAITRFKHTLCKPGVNL